MRILGKYAGALAIALVLAPACKSEEGPDAFMHATIKAVEGQPQALWAALPASYQKDVQGLVTGFADKMNPQVWDEGFKLGSKVVQVLESKKEFVLGHPQVKMFVSPDDTAGWDPAVKAVGTLINSEIKTVEGLKKLEVEKFLAGPVSSIVGDLLKVAAIAEKKMPRPGNKADLATLRERLKKAKITVEKVEGDTAVVKTEIEGDEPEVTPMVKVEGKWIPKELADAWQGGLAQAKAAVEEVKIEPAMIVQFGAIKGMVDPVLDGMLAAKTQDEFNAQIDAVSKVLAGGGLGGMAQGEPGAKVDQAAAEDEAEEKPEPRKRGKKKKRNR